MVFRAVSTRTFSYAVGQRCFFLALVDLRSWKLVLAVHLFPSENFAERSVRTAVVRRRFVNFVDDCNGTNDRLSTFDDYSGSPTQSTGPGWDDVTGLRVLNGIP
jgi:hypothetical protein